MTTNPNPELFRLKWEYFDEFHFHIPSCEFAALAGRLLANEESSNVRGLHVLKRQIVVLPTENASSQRSRLVLQWKNGLRLIF